MFPILLNVVLAAGAGDAGVGTAAAMHGAFDAMAALTWRTSRPVPARDPEVLAALQTLASVAHRFEGAEGKEPGLAAVGALFETQVARTRERVAAGEVTGLAQRVRTLSTLCFTCHTREPVPHDFVDPQARFEALKLSTLERAELLASVRQFDAALPLFLQALKAGEADPAALDEALTVLVRAKNDATATALFLGELAHASLAPPVQAKVAAARAEVRAWQADRFDARDASGVQVLAHAQALVKTGGRVASLRALTSMSRFLELHPRAPERGAMLWALATAARQAPSTFLWELDWLYLEACVRENPNTPLGRQCFGQLEREVTLGYSGSSGTHLPVEETQRLDQLRALAR